jgi:hypothetical protein
MKENMNDPAGRDNKINYINRIKIQRYSTESEEIRRRTETGKNR